MRGPLIQAQGERCNPARPSLFSGNEHNPNCRQVSQMCPKAIGEAILKMGVVEELNYGTYNNTWHVVIDSKSLTPRATFMWDKTN